MGESRSMKLPGKILLVAVALAGLSMLTFVWWGDTLEAMFGRVASAETMAGMKSTGWLLGIGLLVVDIVLPVPATGVMSALGTVYGFWLGWLFGASGSVLSGLVAYGAVRAGGDRVATRFAKAGEMAEFRALFDRWGGLAIVGSRMMPILPEVMTVLAGLARMRFRTFLAALMLGTVPVSALFAWWGSYVGTSAPGASLAVAVAAPVGLWVVFLAVFRRRRRRAGQQDGSQV